MTVLQESIIQKAKNFVANNKGKLAALAGAALAGGAGYYAYQHMNHGDQAQAAASNEKISQAQALKEIGNKSGVHVDANPKHYFNNNATQHSDKITEKPSVFNQPDTGTLTNIGARAAEKTVEQNKIMLTGDTPKPDPNLALRELNKPVKWDEPSSLSYEPSLGFLKQVDNTLVSYMVKNEMPHPTTPATPVVPESSIAPAPPMLTTPHVPPASHMQKIEPDQLSRGFLKQVDNTLASMYK